MSRQVFRFKQFAVDQSGCAMKINTDGVLLGAIAGAENPANVLDIGTGTGVIALMLAQRFGDARIDAVEIDESAAKTAESNFKNSPFSTRLKLAAMGIDEFFTDNPENKYDLIVSNPPFYLNSLESPEANKTLAKHADVNFFEGLMRGVSDHLTPDGMCWLVLPVQTASLVKDMANQNSMYLQKTFVIRSFKESAPHREIICFGFDAVAVETVDLNIYQSEGIYAGDYKAILKSYFLAF